MSADQVVDVFGGDVAVSIASTASFSHRFSEYDISAMMWVANSAISPRSDGVDAPALNAHQWVKQKWHIGAIRRVTYRLWARRHSIVDGIGCSRSLFRAEWRLFHQHWRAPASIWASLTRSCFAAISLYFILDIVLFVFSLIAFYAKADFHLKLDEIAFLLAFVLYQHSIS